MSYSWHIIGNRIRKCREEIGLNQEQLSEAISEKTSLSESRQLIGGWENGTPVKKLEQLLAMCEIFECDMSFLLCECDTKRVLSQPLAHYLGISEKALDILRTETRNNGRIPKIVSDLIEDNSNSIYDDGFRILDQIISLEMLSLGSGSMGYEATFEDIFSDKKHSIFITPNDLYNNSLMALHNSIDTFIHDYREKNQMPYYG